MGADHRALSRSSLSTRWDGFREGVEAIELLFREGAFSQRSGGQHGSFCRSQMPRRDVLSMLCGGCESRRTDQAHPSGCASRSSAEEQDVGPATGWGQQLHGQAGLESRRSPASSPRPGLLGGMNRSPKTNAHAPENQVLLVEGVGKSEMAAPRNAREGSKSRQPPRGDTSADTRSAPPLRPMTHPGPITLCRVSTAPTAGCRCAKIAQSRTRQSILRLRHDRRGSAPSKR